jgi:hypothetical protein
MKIQILAVLIHQPIELSEMNYQSQTIRFIIPKLVYGI